MAKYKNFGELKENDFIFSVEISKTSIEQNCVGSIYNRYIITKIENGDNENEMMFTLAYDKSTFLKNWKLKNNTTDFIIIKVNTSAQTKVIETKIQEDEINCIVFSTNIESLVEKVDSIIDDERNRIYKIKEHAKHLEAVLSNFYINYGVRKGRCEEFIETNKKPEYKELIVTEEVIV